MVTTFKEILEASEKDGCELRFGEFLFGEFKKFYKKEFEKDTPTEKMIFQYILNFIRGDYMDTSKDGILLSAFDTLNNCRNKYKNILMPDKTELYRGIGITKKELKGLTLTKSDKKDYSEGTYKYRGKSMVQSWTPNFHSAALFSKTAEEKNLIPAILFYKFSKKSLLFNSKFLNKLSKLSGYGSEDEIIRIENKAIKCKVYISNDQNS